MKIPLLENKADLSLSIKSLMKQLFFRLNQQQFRNAKYKKKTPASMDNDTDSEHGHQPSSQSGAYDNVAIPVAQIMPKNQGHTSSATVTKKKMDKSSKTSDSGIMRSSTIKEEEDDSRRADIYEVPLSPEPFHSSVSCDPR
jgi:hypothetical protein